MTSLSVAWDKAWAQRSDGGSVTRNVPKAKKIINELWNRPYLINMRKLEVGCGPCDHIKALSSFCPLWKKDYTGIDVSPFAVDIAVKNGFNAIAVDFNDFVPERPFNLFLFLDVLEHCGDLTNIAIRVRSMAASDLVVIGNVPMGVESVRNDITSDRPITAKEIGEFVDCCGCDSITTDIYGANNMPFMFFEATNYKEAT